MRIRKKKNLESRLAECKNLLIIDHEDRDFRSEKTDFLDFNTIFKNNHAIHLEIGCGKGQFICQTAKNNPDLNFIAIEKCANVVVQACEAAMRERLDNVIFIKMDAEYLLRYFKPQSVARIYLNFSCPFPKNKHESHRLTNLHFLQKYKVIMSESAKIWQKTDNMHFFEYSIEQYTQAGMLLEKVTFDLHHSDFEGNIVTEYENRFVSQGLPIYRLEASFR